MTDFLMLVKRDHRDLEQLLEELLEASTVPELRSALDGVRLGLVAHAAAEDIVLHAALQNEQHSDHLERLIGQTRAAHIAQEAVLASLVCGPPDIQIWRDRAFELRDLVRDHAFYEETQIIPVIRELAPTAYTRLAGQFATERLRQLAMVQPSAPTFVVDLGDVAQAC